MSDNPVHRHIGKLMKHHQEQSFLIHSFCPDYHCDAIGFMVVLIHLVHLVGGNLKILGTELAGKGFQGSEFSAVSSIIILRIPILLKQ